MKKLVTGLAGLIAVSAAASVSAATYSASGYLTSYSVQAGSATTLSFLPNPLTFSGDWDVDFTTGVFSADLYFGDFRVTASTSLGGGASYSYGINHAVGGAGNWNAGTNTFSFSIPTGASQSGIASVGTQSAPMTCTPSGFAGNLACSAALGTTLNWEGFSVTLNFSPDLSTFTGTVQSVSKSGSGFTANTTTQNYAISGVAAVPVPAAAWLFGSALLGLAGITRRRM